MAGPPGRRAQAANKQAQARQYTIEHPFESKAEVARAVGCSDRTVAIVRAELIREGLIAPSRKADRQGLPPLPAAADVPPPPPPPPTRAEQQALRDHAAMQRLAQLMEELDGLDDAEIQKRLTKQVLGFALDPTLTPDTRMSAHTLWEKSKDRAKVRDLGPGAPVTFEEAVARMTDLMAACGPKITLAAVNAAFEVKEASNEGQVSADTGPVVPNPPNVPGAPGSPPDVPVTA